MIKAEITLTEGTLEQVRAALEYFSGNNANRIIPNTLRAFNQSVRSIQRAWQNWAMGGSLKGVADIKSASPKLASSIKVDHANDLSAEVYTESQQMAQIQEGRRTQDMKRTYPFGRKSRVSKNNIPYLIIPFRWGTPTKSGINRAHFGNAITPEAYKIVRAFEKSRTTGKTHPEENATGDNIERAEYEWGDRLDDEEFSKTNMNGMVKMEGNSYFTFRVISMNSKPESWWKKEVPPNDVVNGLAEELQPQIEGMIEAGLEADLDL